MLSMGLGEFPMTGGKTPYGEYDVVHMGMILPS